MLAGTTTATTTTKPPQKGPKQKKRPIVLWLPKAKAPHLPLYQKMIDSGQLRHSVKYQRGNPDQRTKWKNAMRPPRMMEWPIYDEGTMLLQTRRLTKRELDDRILVPDWTRTSLNVPSEIDHIIELQVLGANWPAWANTMQNFEVLDEFSNGSSGTRFKNNIQWEREEMAHWYQDSRWTTEYDLVFEHVLLETGGASGERWSAPDVQQGRHLTWYRKLKQAP
jgi:hypothetical protein